MLETANLLNNTTQSVALYFSRSTALELDIVPFEPFSQAGLPSIKALKVRPALVSTLFLPFVFPLRPHGLRSLSVFGVTFSHSFVWVEPLVNNTILKS